MSNKVSDIRKQDTMGQSQMLLANIIQTAMDAIIAVDEEQNIFICNPAAERMFQLSASEVRGKPLTMLIPQHFRKQHEVNVRFFDQSGHTKRSPEMLGVVYGLRANGEEFPLEASISRIEIQGKKYFTAILRDATESQRAEQALQNSLKETDRSRKLLLALSEAGRAIQQARAIEEIYQIILNELSGLGYRATVLLALQDDPKHLVLSHSSYLSGALKTIEKISGLSARNYRLSVMPGSFLERSLQTGETTFTIGNVSMYEEILPENLRSLAGKIHGVLGNQNSICARLMLGSEIHGILAVEGSDLSEVDVPSITAFASQTSIALKNIRLLEELKQELQERKRVEEALRESENHFRALVENSAEVIALIGPTGTISSVSHSVTAIFGFTLNEVVGHNALELIHPEDRKSAAEKLAEILKEPTKVLSAVFRVRHKNGIWRWVEAVASNLLLEPSVQAIVINFRDITESKSVQEKLINSEAELRALFAAMHDVVLIIDRDGVYRKIAPTNPSLLYRPAEQLLGKSLADVFPSELAEQFLTSIHRVLSTKQTEQIEYNLLIGDRPIWFATSISPIDEENCIWVARDVTERKRAEETLRKTEEKYRSIFENAIEGIHQTSPDGKIVTANPAAAYMLGYDSPNEIIASINNLNNHFYVDPDRRQEFKRLMKEQGMVLKFESEIFRRDGSTIWISENSREVRDDHHNLLYYEGTSEDITERKHREYELETIAIMSNALRNAVTRAEMLPEVLDQLMELLKADGAAFAFIEPSSDDTIYELGRGELSKSAGLRIPKGEGVTWNVITSHQPYVIKDINTDSRFVRPDLLGDIKAIACIPLITQDQAIGALLVGRRTEIKHQELRLLASIADIAANALHRASLYEQTLKHLELLAALRTIDLTISGDFDLKTTLGVVLEKAIHHLKIDAADILLLGSEYPIFKFGAGQGFQTHVMDTILLPMAEVLPGKAIMERQIVHIDNLPAMGERVKRKWLITDEQFVSYHAVPLIAKGKVRGVLEAFLRTPLKPNAEWLQFLEALAGQAAIAIDNVSLFQDLQRSNFDLTLAYDETIEGWSHALDLRDRETEGHTLRVTEITLQLVQKMGINDQQLIHIRRGALLHDIGKMGVPDSILLKPGKLTDDEWVIMHQHPQFAYEMLSPITYLHPALDIPYCHHEKWDGTGYPRKLKGEQIPLAARIFAVTDVYDALTSDRPYRSAWSKEQALNYIRKQSGKHFDPQVLDEFLNMISKT